MNHSQFEKIKPPGKAERRWSIAGFATRRHRRVIYDRPPEGIGQPLLAPPPSRHLQPGQVVFGNLR